MVVVVVEVVAVVEFAVAITLVDEMLACFVRHHFLLVVALLALSQDHYCLFSSQFVHLLVQLWMLWMLHCCVVLR